MVNECPLGAQSFVLWNSTCGGGREGSGTMVPATLVNDPRSFRSIFKASISIVVKVNQRRDDVSVHLAQVEASWGRARATVGRLHRTRFSPDPPLPTSRLSRNSHD